LYDGALNSAVVVMGVLDRAKEISGLADSEDEPEPYVCLSCEATFEVQHHSCPECGGYDIRRKKWLEE
jgi:rRNA maturation endonuclease Nob1